MQEVFRTFVVESLGSRGSCPGFRAYQVFFGAMPHIVHPFLGTHTVDTEVYF